MKKALSPVKVFSTVLSLILFATNCAFAYSMESNFWSERRKRMGAQNSENPKKSIQLAGLPHPSVDSAALTNRLWIVRPLAARISEQIKSSMKALIDTAPGRRIFDFTNFRKDFEEARKKAGIPHFEFKDLRRTAARAIWDVTKNLLLIK
jgi:integrase